MLQFNEAKVYVDQVDQQLVALMIESGNYYTFNETATAVLTDLHGGYALPEIEEALREAAGTAFDREKLDAFMKEIVECGIMEENGEEAAERAPEMACRKLSLTDSEFDLLMDGYDDVAAYFQIDPIHEADPDLGWPYEKPEE